MFGSKSNNGGLLLLLPAGGPYSAGHACALMMMDVHISSFLGGEGGEAEWPGLLLGDQQSGGVGGDVWAAGGVEGGRGALRCASGLHLQPWAGKVDVQIVGSTFS